MADGVAFVEVRTEQGTLVHRFTVTLDDCDKHGPRHLVQSIIDALPATAIARKVQEAMRT